MRDLYAVCPSLSATRRLERLIHSDVFGVQRAVVHETIRSFTVADVVHTAVGQLALSLWVMPWPLPATRGVWSGLDFGVHAIEVVSVSS